MLEIILESLELFENTDLVIEPVSDPVKKLISLLGNNEYSFSQLMNMMGLKHRDTFRKNYINPAIELGLIELTIPNNKNSPKQKYKLKKRL